MKAKKTNYQVTIGYKAVLTMDVKAENEEDAKKLAIEEFKGYLHFGNKASFTGRFIRPLWCC